MSWMRVLLPAVVSVLLLSGCASSGSGAVWQQRGNLPFPLATDSPSATQSDSASVSPSGTESGQEVSPSASSSVSASEAFEARLPDLAEVSALLDRSDLRWFGETTYADGDFEIVSVTAANDTVGSVAIFQVGSGFGSVQEAIQYYESAVWAVDRVRDDVAFLAVPGQFMAMSTDGSVVIAATSFASFEQAERLLGLMRAPAPAATPSSSPSASPVTSE